MSSYPGAIYSPRTKANKAGVIYDPSQETKLFAEDISYDDDEIVAIETELGIDPKGASADVATRLDEIDTTIGDIPSDTMTLTNKRITARVQSVSDAATITPDADDYDVVDITAIAQNFTIANPDGTPTNFQKFIIRIKDNATARTITWGNGYVACGVALPTTTILGKILVLGFIYNTANSLNKWQLIASAQEA